MNIPVSLKNYFTYAGATFLVSLAVLFFVVLPLHEKIRSESDEIQKIVAKTENADRKIARLPEFESQHAVIRENEDRIRLTLSEDRTVDFIREIESLATKAGGEVTITQGATPAPGNAKAAAPKETEDGEAPAKIEPKTIGESLPWEKSLRLNVRFSGSYPESVNFLRKIETMPYRLDVLSIDFRPIQDIEKRPVGIVEVPVPSSSEPPGGRPSPAAPAPPEPTVSSEFSVDAAFEVAVYLE